ncbi:MAG: hypothetical protein ACYTG6_00265 [Planctomycetota bacterium]|jgi:HEAT repeat protein
MNRIAWAAILLLAASNAAWFVAWRERAGSSEAASRDRDETEQTIADLRFEVERLRRASADVTVSDPAGEGAGGISAAGEEEIGPTLQGMPPPPEPEPDAEGGEAAARTAAEQEAIRRAQEAARQRAQEMLEKIMQVRDPVLRQEGLRELADALAGEDPLAKEFALSVLFQSRSIGHDPGTFLPLVERLLDSEHAGIRRSALYALHALDPERADLRLALASATDPDPIVRRHASRILSLYAERDFRGEVGEAVLGLLADENPGIRKETLRGMWGAQVSPEVAERLIEIAGRPAERYDAVYFGLSTLDQKSREVVDALVEALEDDNYQIRQRAHWGLQRSVAEDVQYYVAQRYADHIDQFVNPATHREALRLIARQGDARLAPTLDRFAENELVDPEVRELATRAAEYLRRERPAR